MCEQMPDSCTENLRSPNDKHLAVVDDVNDHNAEKSSANNSVNLRQLPVTVLPCPPDDGIYVYGDSYEHFLKAIPTVEPFFETSSHSKLQNTCRDFSGDILDELTHIPDLNFEFTNIPDLDVDLHALLDDQEKHFSDKCLNKFRNRSEQPSDAAQIQVEECMQGNEIRLHNTVPVSSTSVVPLVPGNRDIFVNVSCGDNVSIKEQNVIIRNDICHERVCIRLVKSGNSIQLQLDSEDLSNTPTNEPTEETLIWAIVIKGLLGLAFLDELDIIHLNIGKQVWVRWENNCLQMKVGGFQNAKKQNQQTDVTGVHPESMSPEVCKFVLQKGTDGLLFGITDEDLTGKAAVFSFARFVMDFFPSSNRILQKIAANVILSNDGFKDRHIQEQSLIILRKAAKEVFIQSLIPDECPPTLKRVLSRMLEYEPKRRISAKQALQDMETDIEFGEIKTNPVDVTSIKSESSLPVPKIIFTARDIFWETSRPMVATESVTISEEDARFFDSPFVQDIDCETMSTNHVDVTSIKTESGLPATVPETAKDLVREISKPRVANSLVTISEEDARLLVPTVVRDVLNVNKPCQPSTIMALKNVVSKPGHALGNDMDTGSQAKRRRLNV